jgi:hypothetical protein
MDEHELDERLQPVLTPVFDQRIRQLHASRRQLTPEGRIELAEDVRIRLNAALDGLYIAFSCYKMNDPLSYCNCCLSVDDVRKLRSTPLRELTHDDLWTVASNIVLTMGDDRDFRYFLPRMIEGLTENATYFPEFVFDRVSRTDFPAWPLAEQEALIAYLWAQFGANITIEPGSYGIWSLETLLCCIGVAGFDPDPFLSAWASSNDGTALKNLVSFVAGEVSAAHPPQLKNAFWTVGPAHSRVIRWLRLPATIALIESAYERFPLDGYAASDFSEALDALK